jgi:diguanylate cyclase (GGDEF)-like protein
MTGQTDAAILNQIYRLFLSSGDLESVIEKMMPLVGSRFQVSRLYIMDISLAPSEELLFEWTDGQTGSIREGFEKQAYWSLYDAYHDFFDQNPVMRIDDIHILPAHLRDFFDAQGTCATLQCAIAGNGHCLGFMGMDMCTEPRGWTDAESEDAVQICWLLANAMLRKQAEKKAESAQIKIQRMAYYDPLLDTPNRYKCEMDLEQAIRYAVSHGETGSLIFLDINNFRSFNDIWGYAYGDLLLKKIAEFLNTWVETGRLYHFSSDEFIILLTRMSEKQARSHASKILTRFKKPWVLDDKNHTISVSIGLVHFPEHGADSRKVLQNATIAVHHAKKQGKNILVAFSQEISLELQSRADMEMKMQSAIQNHFQEFKIFYQPIVDAKSGECVACEALLRWHNPDLGFVLPGEFIPLAEQTGLIIPIGEWMLEKICEECKKWTSMGANNAVSVNLSVQQLFNDDTVNVIQNALKKSALSPASLIVEITENPALRNFSALTACLRRLRDIGVRIAMDDFGTGFSSLSNLSMLPLDIIKIDRGFTADVTNAGYKRAFIQTIIHLAHSLGLKVCIEGVETQDQCDWILLMQSDYMQGYFFNRPVPDTAFFDIPSIQIPHAVTLTE